MAFINSPPPTISGLSTTQPRKGSFQAALQGLQSNFPSGSPADPLGENIALTQRAQGRAHEYYDPLVQQPGLTGAVAMQQRSQAEQMDPQGFNALNQALYERGARVTSAPGLSRSPLGQPSTMFAPDQTSAVTGGHYGVTGYGDGKFQFGDTADPQPVPPAIQGLKKVRR
jgi:hypothetical protein